MSEMQEVQERIQTYNKYGVVNPEKEFISVWNEDKYTYELFNTKELIDSVRARIEEIKARRK